MASNHETGSSTGFSYIALVAMEPPKQSGKLRIIYFLCASFKTNLKKSQPLPFWGLLVGYSARKSRVVRRPHCPLLAFLPLCPALVLHKPEAAAQRRTLLLLVPSASFKTNLEKSQPLGVGFSACKSRVVRRPRRPLLPFSSLCPA